MGFGALIWGRGRRDLLRRVNPRDSMVRGGRRERTGQPVGVVERTSVEGSSRDDDMFGARAGQKPRGGPTMIRRFKIMRPERLHGRASPSAWLVHPLLSLASVFSPVTLYSSIPAL